eukprot:g1926.t1
MASLSVPTPPHGGGQITVFSLSTCQHCAKAKQVLRDRAWPFVEISLDAYPQAKTSMLQLSDRLTVPQIFFNEKHIGGSSDLEIMGQDGRLDALYRAMRGTDAPSDKRFRIPEGVAPAVPKEAPALTESDLCIGGLLTSYSEVYARITGTRENAPSAPSSSEEGAASSHSAKGHDFYSSDPSAGSSTESSSDNSPSASSTGDSDSDGEKGQPNGAAGKRFSPNSARKGERGSMVLDIRDRKYYLQTYRRCFYGSQLVDVLIDQYNLHSREEGRQVAEMLSDAHMFRHVTNEHGFEDSTKYFYRMTADEEPLVLNTWRVWNDRVDDDSLAMLDRCSTFLDRILSRHRNDKGLVAYDAVADDEAFQQFEEMSCEIQTVDLAKLSLDSRVAFAINVYNMMVKHAFAKVGRPETLLKRDAFFNNVSYNIGGLVYSLNEIENGVLRGNKRPPGFHISKPFGNGDPRLKAVMPKVDPRIHFALNCGAKSCPPVKRYTAPNVQEELRVVALAFCEQDSNVSIDVESKTLSTSRIFYWYANDFGNSTEEVLARIGEMWLRGERKAVWQEMLVSGKYRHKRLNYDWTTDAQPSSKSFQGVPRGK